ncbi:MAG: ribonuclease P protein component [Proteobacteria bacterium]|nr:ribonuclease P protein component [Pseudomonadota bacterium]
MRRLRTRAQFQALLTLPPVARTTHFALHRLPLAPDIPDAPARPALFPAPTQVWLGAMAPKRWARRAVTRNTIRRQIYAVGDQLMPTLPPGAHLVRLRAAFATSRFASASSAALKQAVRAELLQLFARGAA